MTTEAKKSVSKISLALLIVVISLVSTQVSAQEAFEYKLAKICKNEVQHKSAYEREHRKCFAAGTKKMTWQLAKEWCEQLPQLPHFGRPALATIDLQGAQMWAFINNTMKAHPGHWVGGYIPFAKVSQTTKDNNEWRWVADGSRLSASHPAWNKRIPGPQPESGYPKENCAAMHHEFGMHDLMCNHRYPPLCHYEAKEAKICPYPKLPKNTYWNGEKLDTLQGTVATVYCTGDRVVKGTKYDTEQLLICKNGIWTTRGKECV